MRSMRSMRGGFTMRTHSMHSMREGMSHRILKGHESMDHVFFKKSDILIDESTDPDAVLMLAAWKMCVCKSRSCSFIVLPLCALCKKKIQET